MLIPYDELRVGDILVFKGGGLVFEILGRILKLSERHWDRWGWHTGFVVYGNQVCESIAEGIVLSPLSKYKPEETRVYRWLDTPPTNKKINTYLKSHLGKRYDVAIYFWTALQYLIRHFWNRRIPRLLNDRFTCWENISEFCDDMGKPILSHFDCPMLPDILLELEK